MTRARTGTIHAGAATSPARHPSLSPDPRAHGVRTLRCAVYTRKSSEEGLDMAFNSLDAQREAGMDYIRSQRSHGWVAIPASYDDGGYSGGTTERPGLQRLMADIGAGRVDIVVVYKVDRLSRSLNDFARLMQTFDEQQVSFVSVTQQFNTTTSMGRLTLNMLLSFAQFEREVAGERIRDKIGATMRKGIFVVGQAPIGYRRPKASDPDPDNRVIRVVPEEAALVRRIYTLYLEHHSLLKVAQTLNADGMTTKRWTSGKQRSHGGRPWTGPGIHRVLSNPVYIGKIEHTRGSHLPRGKGRGPTEVWPGQHEAIIDLQIWQRVRALMETHATQSRASWSRTHLLKGKLRTHEGFTMTPANSVAKRSGKPHHRVAYYVSLKATRFGYANCPIRSINAGRIDDLVRAMVLDRLETAHGLMLDALDSEARDRWVREIVELVVLAPDQIEVAVGVGQIRACAKQHGMVARPKPGTVLVRRCHYTPEVGIEHGVGPTGEPEPIRETLTIRIEIKRHDGKRVVVSKDGQDLMPRLDPAGRPVPSPHIVRAIGQAFALHEEVMRTGMGLEASARALGMDPARGRQLHVLTRLSPTILKAALTGTLSAQVSLADLRDAAREIDWSNQAAHLGL